MAERWQKSDWFPDVHYYGDGSVGCLEKISGVWIWHWFERGVNGVTFGSSLREAKICAAALVELEG